MRRPASSPSEPRSTAAIRALTNSGRKRVLVQVEQSDLRTPDRRTCAIEVPACPDADVEVTPAEVAVVTLQHHRTRTPPRNAVREPEHEQVVDAERERRVDPLPTRDIGCTRRLGLARLPRPNVKRIDRPWTRAHRLPARASGLHAIDVGVDQRVRV